MIQFIWSSRTGKTNLWCRDHNSCLHCSVSMPLPQKGHKGIFWVMEMMFFILRWVVVTYENSTCCKILRSVFFTNASYTSTTSKINKSKKLSNKWKKDIWGTAKTQKKLCIFTNFIQTKLFLNPHQQNTEKASKEENDVGKISSHRVGYGSKTTILTLRLDESPLRGKILRTKIMFSFLEIQ